jgi:hypothetical protein
MALYHFGNSCQAIGLYFSWCTNFSNRFQCCFGSLNHSRWHFSISEQVVRHTVFLSVLCALLNSSNDLLLVVYLNVACLPCNLQNHVATFDQDSGPGIESTDSTFASAEQWSGPLFWKKYFFLEEVVGVRVDAGVESPACLLSKVQDHVPTEDFYRAFFGGLLKKAARFMVGDEGVRVPHYCKRILDEARK